MHTVFFNLIDNGIKFSADQDKSVEVRLGRKNHSALVTVSDYGTGIDEAEIPFILEPFYRVDKSRSRKTGGSGRFP